MLAFVAVGIGAALGAWLRWWLGMLLNPVFPTLPFGTLAANVLGGLLMGLTVGALTQFEALPAPLRLMVTTGFLGALTTFSTFSAEAVLLILREQYAWFAMHVSAHLAGALGATLVGVGIFKVVARSLA